MRYITNTLDFQLEKRSVVTLGKFDGLHRGHDKLITRTLELGKKGYDTVVFTFDVSPLVKLGTRITRTLLTNEERKVLLERKRIDCLIECPFVPELIQMEPEDFIREVLAVQLRAAYVIVGPDFHFGYKRKGTPELLKKLGHRYGFEVEILDKEMDEEREISSTWIRETLREGRIEKVNHLLGYPYFVKGKVVHGRQLGRTWGLPTINQIPANGKLLPPFGVYASKTYINGEEFYGISNIGVKPTVEVPFAGVETYLFECNENLYGKEAWVEFYHFMRTECKFDSVEELREQIQRDAQAGRNYFRDFCGQR
ncbi:bifunctional riboflavin kinase/FAD synthetase [bacterium]|nr:bifunctional riboflavin kinase/FAD synthetase [bacterium]MDY3022671.1 bifunctional riboflavin kinase/FAD synthetase [Oliverpabstia sp.]